MIQGSLTKLDGMESLKGFYGMSKNNEIFGAIAQAYYFLVGTGSIPARLFLRKNLGERAFSVFAFISCIFFFLYYGFFPLDDNFMILGVLGVVGSFGAYQMLGESFEISKFIAANIILNPCLWFIIWMVWKGIKHFKLVVKNAKENKIQYSYYRGDGKYFEHRKGEKKWGFDVDERFIRMIIEPMAVFRYGFLLLIVSLVTGMSVYKWGDQISSQLGYALIFFSWLTNLGLLLMFSGFCLFLEEFGIMTRIRDAALDLIDGEYDMAFVMKKKEDLLLGKINTDENIRLAEDIYQSNIEIATMASMPKTPVDH